MSNCETYKDNLESREDDGGLACDVSEESKDYQGHLCSIFELKTSKVKSCFAGYLARDEELVVIKKRPQHH